VSLGVRGGKRLNTTGLGYFELKHHKQWFDDECSNH